MSQRKIIIYWLTYITINKSKAGWTASKINLMMIKTTGVSIKNKFDDD